MFIDRIFCIPTQSYSQNIASARDQGEGAIVTVSGVVTNGDELGGPIRYIEDATAGLAIYDPEVMSNVNRGDSITVTGVLVDYNGLLEVQPVNDLINHEGYEINPKQLPQIKLAKIQNLNSF